MKKMTSQDYTKFNFCSNCRKNFPKQYKYCNTCKQLLRTKPHHKKRILIQELVRSKN